MPTSRPWTSSLRRPRPDDVPAAAPAAAQRRGRTHPIVVSLAGLPEAELADGLRAERRRLSPSGGRRLVIDLGERRTLPADAVIELVFLHRALSEVDGRCAVILDPVLAAQISVAYPEGILCAATHGAAAALLARGAATVELRRGLKRGGLLVRPRGGLDLSSLPRVQGRFERAVAAAEAGQVHDVRLELGGVTFCDAAGLHAIINTVVRSQLAGARVCVTGAGAQILRLAYRLGWQDMLPGLRDSAVLAEGRRGRFQRTGPTPVGRVSRDEVPFLLDDGARAVVATSLHGVVTHWNHAARDLYGWTATEAVGRPMRELTGGPDDELGAHETLEIVRRTGVWEGTAGVRGKDGRAFQVHLRNLIVEDDYGRSRGVVEISRALRVPAPVAHEG